MFCVKINFYNALPWKQLLKNHENNSNGNGWAEDELA